MRSVMKQGAPGRHAKVLFLAVFSCFATSIGALASPSSRTVLVTGGAGYIGSHTCLELLEDKEANYSVVVVDNLDNSSEGSLKRVLALTKCDKDRLHFRQCDLRDRAGLSKGGFGFIGKVSFGASHFTVDLTNIAVHFPLDSTGRVPRH